MTVYPVNFRVLPSGLAIPADAATETAPAGGPVSDDADNIDTEGAIPCLHPNRSNAGVESGHVSEYGAGDEAA